MQDFNTGDKRKTGVKKYWDFCPINNKKRPMGRDGVQTMLILTRRIGETLIIGDDIQIHILEVNGNQIRLGIDAPKHVSVHRSEIYMKIQAEKNTTPEKISPPAKPIRAKTSNTLSLPGSK